jgi:hypothetical protein
MIRNSIVRERHNGPARYINRIHNRETMTKHETKSPSSYEVGSERNEEQ